MASLDCLQPFGMMVSFGNASGPVPPFDLSVLAAKGSLFVTRATLKTYTAKREDLVASANDLFDVVHHRQGEDRDQPALCARRTRSRRIAISRRARPPARPSAAVARAAPVRVDGRRARLGEAP